MAKPPRRGVEPRFGRDSRGPNSLPRLLGQLARATHHGRTTQENRRSNFEGAGGHVLDRGGESPPRARVAGMGKKAKSPRGGVFPRRGGAPPQIKRAES